jgi:hypothetical protein
VSVDRTPTVASLRHQAGRRKWLVLRRPISERLAAIRQLTRLAAGSERADAALGGVWAAACAEKNGTLLRVIAESLSSKSGLHWVERLVSALVVRCDEQDGDGDARTEIANALLRFGSQATEPLVDDLLRRDGEAFRWIVLPLRLIGLSLAAPRLGLVFAQADDNGRRRLLDGLANVRHESWEDLIGLMASLASRRPPESQMLEGLTARCGRKDLETECLRLWTRSKKVAARTLLERHLGYDRNAFDDPSLGTRGG